MAIIQKFSISNITSDVLTVELTVADNPLPEKATVHVTARLPVKRRGHSLESIEAAAFDALIEVLHDAAPARVKQRMRIVY